MNNFSLEDRTLQLLAAQANLNGTFNHTCLSALTGHQLMFRFQVERNSATSTFTLELGGERHSITLPHDHSRIHLRLADFIEAVANGRVDTGEPAVPRITPQPVEAEALLDTEQCQQLRDLLRKGGLLSLDLGFELPLHVAVHRTRSRLGITAILSIGVRRPRTSCFTFYGHDSQAMERLVESILHLAAVATPAMQAA